MLAFSFTLPATRVAVGDLDGTVVGLGRALVPAVLAALLLSVRREALPTTGQWVRLAYVSSGIVVGFPFFSALALESVPSAHGAVMVGLLPAATAAMAVLRAGERPSALFWAAAVAGFVSVLAFATSSGGASIETADLLLLAAVLAAAWGYAEGGALARELGASSVLCWALVLAAPVLAVPVTLRASATGLEAGPTAWAGFAYVSLVSMFLAFFLWYRGLARGGVARIGQVQLVQPVLTLGWAGLFFSEDVSAATVGAAFAVLISVAVAQRARVITVNRFDGGESWPRSR